jgi:sigma-E factor negative regulatory protein RseC
MIKELATVIAINSKQVTVTSKIKSTCSSCSQVDSCGSGQVAKALPHAKLTLTLDYDESAVGKALVLGDSVVLAIPENYVLSSAGQVYLLPLLGLILFSATGQWLYSLQLVPHELVSLAIGIAGGYLGFRLAKFLQKHSKNSVKLQPQIIKVLPSSSQA